MKQHINCIICNYDKLTSLQGYEKAHLCQCDSCDLVFSKVIPTSEELGKYYKNYGINNYLSPLTIKRYNELLDQFEPFRKTNKILDIGCGLGYFLLEAKSRGWEVYGTELSSESANICIQKEINVENGTLKPENYENEMFDIITSFEVIEHINNPRSELQNCYNILRKGGLVYITTPNFNSLLRYRLKAAYNIITYPEHLTYYTPKTLKKLFELSGFKKSNIITTGISLTRFRISSGRSNQKIISAKSDDEKIRNLVDNKWYLHLTKNIINKLLTYLALGDSLKGWFLK